MVCCRRYPTRPISTSLTDEIKRAMECGSIVSESNPNTIFLC